jgi:hypothetical protein
MNPEEKVMKPELDSQEHFLNAFKKLLDDLLQECVMNVMVLRAAQKGMKDVDFKNLKLKEDLNQTVDLFLYDFKKIEQHVKDIHECFQRIFLRYRLG